MKLLNSDPKKVGKLTQKKSEAKYVARAPFFKNFTWRFLEKMSKRLALSVFTFLLSKKEVFFEILHGDSWRNHSKKWSVKKPRKKWRSNPSYTVSKISLRIDQFRLGNTEQKFFIPYGKSSFNGIQ